MMDESFDDPMLEPAVEWVVVNQKVSISAIQRHFRLGYNRAAQIIELMESVGIVSPQGFNGNRTVLCSEKEDADLLLMRFKESRNVEIDMTNVILFPRKN